MDMDHSHNLKFIIVDSNDTRIDDPKMMEYVYSKIANVQFRKHVVVTRYNTQMPGYLCWRRYNLAEHNKSLMGDLFTPTIHSEHLLYESNKYVLEGIEAQYNAEVPDNTGRIKFHISKLLDMNSNEYEFQE
jgi:hypothetical protein